MQDDRATVPVISTTGQTNGMKKAKGQMLAGSEQSPRFLVYKTACYFTLKF